MIVTWMAPSLDRRRANLLAHLDSPALHPTLRARFASRLLDLEVMQAETVPAFSVTYPALDRWRKMALAREAIPVDLAQIAAVELTGLIAAAYGLEGDAAYAEHRAKELATAHVRGARRGAA